MDDRVDRVASRLELPMLVAALLVVPDVVIENSDASGTWDGIANALNWVIWTAFALEFAVLLHLAQDKRHWLRHHLLDVVIVVGTPPFLPAAMQSGRVLRLLRVVRLFRLARLSRELFSLRGLEYAALLALITILGGGVAFAAVEGTSAWNGIWWAVTTVTTVGYGDFAPQTPAGRALGILVMVTGIGFVALLTAALAQRFIAQEVEQEAAKIELPEREAIEMLRDISGRLGQLEQSVRELQQRR